MPSYGSSKLFKTTIQRIVGYTGPTGDVGPTGARGATGTTGYGPTGDTGASVVNLEYANRRITNVFDDDTRITTTSDIIGQTGTYMLGLSGQSLSSEANFLRHTIRQNFTDLSNDDAVRDVTYFRNLKTSTPNQVQISYDNNDNIKVSYNLQDVSDLLVSGGNPGQLAVNLPGNVQRGLTGTFYDTVSATTKTSVANVGQLLKVVDGTKTSTYQHWTCDINNDGNVFFLSQVGNLSLVTTNKIILKTPDNADFAHSMSVIVAPNISNQFPTIFQYTNSSTIDPRNTYSPVVWPLGDAPCLSGEYDLFHFISIGGVWYGYVAAYNKTGYPSGFKNLGVTLDNNLESSLFKCNASASSGLLGQRSGLQYSFSGATYGICCNTSCGFTLTDVIGCTGYFVPGITYNSGLTLCSIQGACCLKTDEGSILKCEELTYCECATIANQSNLQFRWTKFEGLKKSCDDIDCVNSFQGIGACCNGTGSCAETTDYTCAGYWQGLGIKCTTSENKNVCFDGYGACCDSGTTCENGITGSTCFSSNKTYFGDMSKCDYIDCNSESIPCLSIIPNETLQIGDVYENGIVVGIFNPESSSCYGNSTFSFKSGVPLSGNTLESGAKEYNTVYDYSGYGFTLSSRCESSSDSYIMLMSLHPITIDDNNEIVSYTGANDQSSTFVWSNGSSSWGPMFNVQTLEIDEDSFNAYKEGYIYDYNVPETKNNLKFNTFARCNAIRQNEDPIDWANANPNSSFNGKWYRNWGFMNTARMLNSEFYYHAGISYDGITASDYTPTQSGMTISRLVSLYNIKYPQTNEMVSDWFIPSHDELAFISNSCSNVNDNINVKLMLANGTPMNDWYWSSTGTFIVNDEMILNHPNGLTPGTGAWAIKFNVDIDGNFMVAKKTRTNNQYQLRLIRMIRCDGKHYTLSDSNNKYWKMLTLDERTIT
jgi:hypothetical protein